MTASASTALNVLTGVSCTSATACTAVGYSSNASSQQTLAERWNGTSWTIQSTANPTGASGQVLQSGLTGVSCPTAAYCTAVGDYENSNNVFVSLAERWNGTSWTIQSTPNLTRALFTTLTGVSCPTAEDCAAVGYYNAYGNTDLSLAERWNGSAWHIQSTPNSTAATSSVLWGVSCTSGTACTAVGNNGRVTLAERWNGMTWTIQSQSTFGSLAGVSCPTVGDCTAVGVYRSSSGLILTLAERWNGASWTTQFPPNLASAIESDLRGVSCPTSTDCTAVGDYVDKFHNEFTLAMRWNGTAWHVQTTP
jgi:hypothetical protein